jgi:AraC-like DNA-binding protein
VNASSVLGACELNVLDQSERRLGLKCPGSLETSLAKRSTLALGRGWLMVTSAPLYTVVRFSSCALPEHRRGKAIEELCERGSLVTKFAPYGATLPQVDFVNRIMPGLRVLTASYAGVRREGSQQDGDLLYLCITLTGTSLASWRARETVLSDGDAVLMTSAEAGWTLTSPSSVNIAGIRLPRSAIAPVVPKLENAVMRRIPRDAAGLKLLRRYLEVVADDDALALPTSQRLIIGHFYDLVALALGTNCDDQALPKCRTVSAVRLAAIKADIVASLHDGNLSATTVATRNRVTVRYLHKLFHNEGITYSQYVLGERLTRAYRNLRNPLHSQRAISAIAFELGFNDVSYFNRAFRRRYNARPSDVRNVLN